MCRRMHDPHGLVGGEPRFGVRDFIAKPFLPVGDPVGKDHADGFVKVVPPLGGAADLQVDEVPERGPV